MISFSGELNNVCKKHLKRRMENRYLKLFILYFILFVVPGIIVLFMFKMIFLLIGAIIVEFIPYMLLLVSYPEHSPTIISIEEDEISVESCIDYRTCKVEDVKIVYDYGGFFDIVIYSPTRIFNCICQKDLIKEGTIEDFEELFKDYIVRKYKS